MSKRTKVTPNTSATTVVVSGGGASIADYSVGTEFVVVGGTGGNASITAGGGTVTEGGGGGTVTVGDGGGTVWLDITPAVERAVYSHLQAMRALGETSANTAEVARALGLTLPMVDAAMLRLSRRGVRAVR